MKNKKIFVSLFIAISMITSINAFASGDAVIYQYYSDDESITAFVSGISADNPDVRIAGVTCDAKNLGSIYFNAEKYETVFLVDSSASMSVFSDEIDAFLRECIDKKRDNEYYSIGMFSSGNTPEYISNCDNNQYSLERSIENLKYDFQSTYIYDNLINTIDKLYTDEEAIYRRIVLITDGNENSAKGITVDDVIAEIDSNPVPVYTVTLQTSTKDNLENLKSIARLSRKSNAADIRISDGDNAVKSVSVLTEAVKDTYCISISPSRKLMDGSVKAVDISDGSVSAKADIRMPMANQNSPVTETKAAETERTETAAVNTQPAKQEKSSSFLPIIIIAAGVVIAGVIIGIILHSRRKSPPSETGNEHTSLSDNDETMIIRDGSSGETEMLFGDDNAHNTVILRDVADSIRTFEVQLTGQGAIIGRSSDYSNIVIDYDRSVSRKHCRIFLKNGRVYIEDLSSGNRTYVNDSEVISETPLSNADEIRIGRTRLRVTIK